MAPPTKRIRWAVAGLLTVALAPSGCWSGDAERERGGSALPAEPDTVAGVDLYPVPNAVVETCRSIQEKSPVTILCPTRLPRPVRDLAGSSALPPAVVSAFAWDSSGVDFSYSAETGKARLDRPERFFHLQVIQRTQRFPPGTERAALGGKAGLLAPASSASYAAEAYFGNHWRFFWTERGSDYAATLHHFGPRTRRLLDRLIRDLRPAGSMRRRPAGADDPRVRTIDVPVPGPVSVAVGGDSVYVAGQGDLTVSAAWLARIDADSGRVSGERIRVGSGAASSVIADGPVWVGHSGVPGAPGLYRFDPRSGRLEAQLDVRAEIAGLARAAGSLWLLDFGGVPGRGRLIETRAGAVLGTIPVGRAPAAIAARGRELWVTANLDDAVTRIDAATARVAGTVRVGRGPVGVAAGHGAVWVANFEDDTLSRIDPANGRVTDTIRVGRGPRAVAAGAGGIWVTNSLGGTVSRIDPGTRRVREAIRVGAGPTGIAIGAGAVWVANNHDQTVTRIEP